MPITEKGYEARRFQDLLEEIRSSLEATLGTPISSDPATVFGIINSIYANALSVQENNTQALSSNLDLNTAEGIYLDRLVKYIGLTRLPAQPAVGNLKVWRNTVGKISSALLFSDSAGIQYSTVNGLNHQLNECAETLLTPINPTEGLNYTVQINSANFSYTATGSDGVEEVVNSFVSQITTILPSLTVTNESNSLRIVGVDSELNHLNISRINFSIAEVATFNYCESVEQGTLDVAENTITNKISTNSSIIKVNNPLEFNSGVDLETDEELRKRHARSVASGGSATLPAIRAALLQIANVTDLIINENFTLVDTPELPAKSYECVVVGGNPETIAQTIWDEKPAGNETHGDIQTVVDDFIGNTQSVKWSRPTELYTFVEVTYSLYDEESFPTDGEDLIKQAVLDYGDTLTLDNDIIPERFIGGVYRAVDGVGSISIRVGTSTDINDTVPDSGYGTTTIPVGSTEIPIFSLAKVEAIQT